VKMDQDSNLDLPSLVLFSHPGPASHMECHLVYLLLCLTFF
jgi:hypothetical protein